MLPSNLNQPATPQTSNAIGHSLMWLNIAAFTIVLTTIKFFDGVLAPLLASVFAAFVIYPVIKWVKGRGFSHATATLLVMLLMLGGLAGLGGVLGNSASDIITNIDSYQVALQNMLNSLHLTANQAGIPIDLSAINVDSLFSTTEQSMLNIASKAGTTVSGVMIVLVTMGFIVAEAPLFNNKLHQHIRSQKVLVNIDKFVSSMNRYLIAKSAISLAKALLVGVIAWGFDVEFYILIAVLVFLLNFIPNIGPFLAAVPLCLFALLQTGVSDTLVIASLYFAINFVIGNFVEPKFLGNKLGLSALIVFLSLLFWGWLLGPIGLILSVPLTMAVKILLEGSKNYQHISEIMC